MTVLENSTHVDAGPEAVWDILARLDALHEYDPGVKLSKIVSRNAQGRGAVRRCELTPGGWFEERVTDWQPAEALAFELTQCSLPVRSLSYRYRLVPEGAGTRVSQRMEYRLKFGPVGRILDALIVRRRWDTGIKAFFTGLKSRAESVRRTP
jgi:ligand-binding SRPBCC domain-containing protein